MQLIIIYKYVLHKNYFNHFIYNDWMIACSGRDTLSLLSLRRGTFVILNDRSRVCILLPYHHRLFAAGNILSPHLRVVMLMLMLMGVVHVDVDPCIPVY